MIPIPPLIEIKDLTPFKGLKIDVSKIPVTRYNGRNKCDLQFNMLPEKKSIFLLDINIPLKMNKAPSA